MSDSLKTRANWFDNMIGFFSPRSKFERMRFRAMNDIVQRKYEGAGRGRRTSGWKTSSTSATSEIAFAGPVLRDRARDLVRNNPYAARGLQGIVNNVIGKGTIVQFKATPQRRENQVNQIWRAWANDSKVCDFDGQNDYKSLQMLAFRSMVEGGESLVRVRRVGRQFAIDPITGRQVEVPPIQLQVLEGDFIASNRFFSSETNGNHIAQGIEFDASGKRVGYHLFKNHPGSFNVTPISSSSAVFVESSDIAHIYRIDRAGQIRGASWFAPIIIRLRDFDEYEDAQLVRQKIAAMWTAFVHDMQGLDESLTDTEKEELGEKMEPGVIEFLPPGKDIKLASPPGTEGYKEYVSTVLHAIASGLGVTYEILTSDFAEVNFSSARMGFLEFNRNVDAWRANILRPQFLVPTTDWFLSSLNLIGIRSEGIQRVFTSPKREMVDPTKEVPAAKTAVRSGFMTLSEAIRQSGRDPDEHFEELRSDNQKLDEFGLTLDTDPRKVQD